MAQCIVCQNYGECQWRQEWAAVGKAIAPEDYHNCQDFNGVACGYRIYRTEPWPKGDEVIARV